MRSCTFTSDVREVTFTARDDLYLLYLAVNGAEATLERAWLVPSAVLDEHAIRVKIKGQTLLRFSASAKEDTQDKWRRYRLERAALPHAILEAVAALEPPLG